MTDATVKKLGIRDRLVISSILPTEGGLVAQRICRDIKKKIQLTQDEMTSVNMRDVHLPNNQTSVVWDIKDKDGKEIREPVIEVSFTGAELSIVAEQVMKLDKTGKVNQENLETCEKFLDQSTQGKTA